MSEDLPTRDLSKIWAETPLHTAVREGRLSAFATDGGVAPEFHAMDGLGWTPLHLAAAIDDADAIVWLLTHGAAIDVLSDDHRTALALAAAAGAMHAVKALLKAGASVDVKGQAREVLAEAATAPRVEMLQALAQAGAQTKETLAYLLMALRVTGHRVRLGEVGYNGSQCDTPDVWVVDRPPTLPAGLLRPIGLSSMPNTVDGWTRVESRPSWFTQPGAAYESSSSAGPTMTTLLYTSLRFWVLRLEWTPVAPNDVLAHLGPLYYGTTVPAPGAIIALLHMAGLTPGTIANAEPALAVSLLIDAVCVAIDAPSSRMLRRLLAEGLSPNLVDATGSTPLMRAVIFKNTVAVEALLEHGADRSARNANGQTAADIALAFGHPELARLLAPQGAAVKELEASRAFIGAQMRETLQDPDAARLTTLLDQHGLVSTADLGPGSEFSLLALAIEKRKLPHVNALLRAGADVNERLKNGSTPMHFAGSRDVGIMRRLLESGGDPDAKDSTSTRPLHYAASVSHADMIGALVEGGASVDATDENGHTQLAHAISRNQNTAISALLAHGADPRFPDLTGETPMDRLKPDLHGRRVMAEMWMADAQHHGPDRLGPYLKTLIDDDQTLAIQLTLNPATLPGHHSSVARRGALPLEEWKDLARDLSAYCATRGAWPSLNALKICGLPMTLPPTAFDRPLTQAEVMSVTPGDEPAALISAAWIHGGAVPFLLQVAGAACAPALDAALFALGKIQFSPSPEIDAFQLRALRALVAAGANVNARGRDAAIALHSGLRLPKDEKGQLLWDDDRQLAKRDLSIGPLMEGLMGRPDDTPLMHAASESSPLVSLLIAEGADVSASSPDGRNALHRASTAGGVVRAAETVQRLLDAGFAVDQPDAHGWRPLTLASNPEIVRLLVERGASTELSATDQERLGKEASEKLRTQLGAA